MRLTCTSICGKGFTMKTTSKGNPIIVLSEILESQSKNNPKTPRSREKTENQLMDAVIAKFDYLHSLLQHEKCTQSYVICIENQEVGDIMSCHWRNVSETLHNEERQAGDKLTDITEAQIMADDDTD